MQVKRKQNWTRDNGLIQNWERSMSRCILASCLFNLFEDNIMPNAGMNESQTGIKIARRNINNFRYAYDTTLWQKVKTN